MLQQQNCEIFDPVKSPINLSNFVSQIVVAQLSCFRTCHCVNNKFTPTQFVAVSWPNSVAYRHVWARVDICDHCPLPTVHLAVSHNAIIIFGDAWGGGGVNRLRNVLFNQCSMHLSDADCLCHRLLVSVHLVYGDFAPRPAPHL